MSLIPDSQPKTGLIGSRVFHGNGDGSARLGVVDHFSGDEKALNIPAEAGINITACITADLGKSSVMDSLVPKNGFLARLRGNGYKHRNLQKKD
jgi:hypothetical protein